MTLNRINSAYFAKKSYLIKRQNLSPNGIPNIWSSINSGFQETLKRHLPMSNLAPVQDIQERLPIEAVQLSEEELTRHLRSARAKKVYQASRFTEKPFQPQDDEPAQGDDDLISHSSLVSGTVYS